MSLVPLHHVPLALAAFNVAAAGRGRRNWSALPLQVARSSGLANVSIGNEGPAEDPSPEGSQALPAKP